MIHAGQTDTLPPHYRQSHYRLNPFRPIWPPGWLVIPALQEAINPWLAGHVYRLFGPVAHEFIDRPCHRGNSQRQAVKLSNLADGVKVMKILLVDDSRTIRNMQKNVLAQIGYTEVIEASDGVEALTQIAKDKPDLVLVEWNMPNMNGITLVRKIRETDKKLRLIMVTAEANKSHVIQAIKAGVNNYVVKPFTAETLSEKIQQTLAKVAAIAGAET